jgi:dethiobiotin synthetase
MTHAFFLTGTDTLIGKTTIGAGLLALARHRNLPCAGWKPVASGCPRRGDKLVSEDALLLALGAQGSTHRVIQPPLHVFEEAVAPGVAAERTGRTISLDEIASQARAITSSGAFTLIEGAGGFLVPLGGSKTFADLALRLALPILLVARASLGTINHTLLTIEAIRARGLTLAGVILNDATEETATELATSNASEIACHSSAPVLGYIPLIRDPSPDNVAESIAQRLALAPLGLAAPGSR